MTVIPSDSHFEIMLSKSRMFVDARYIAGVMLCSCAIAVTVFIGDGWLLPVANQLSSSGAQKSSSSCVMMACVSVITTLSMMVNATPWLFRCSINLLLGVVFFGVGSSKFIDVNTGASGNVATSS